MLWTHGFGAHSCLSNIKILEKPETVQQQNAVQYFHVFSKERDYLVLLRTYSCTTTDSVGNLKCKVLEHYTNICAAREATD